LYSIASRHGSILKFARSLVLRECQSFWFVPISAPPLQIADVTYLGLSGTILQIV
jgi:hypothetical protein